MFFDFSIYPYREKFPEVTENELFFEKVFPINIVSEEQIVLNDENTEALIDFGVESVGYLKFYARGEGLLKITYGEWKDELFDHGDKSVDWYERPEDWQEIKSATAKEIKITRRRAFRYVLIKRIKGNIIIERIKTEAVTCRKKYDTEFRCSDNLLNDIYDICKRTTSYCMQSYFEDGVKRDGLLWGGDARIEAKANYAIFGNTEIVKRSIKYFLRSMRYDGMLPADAVVGGAVIHPKEINYMFDYVGGKVPEGTPGYYNSCGEIYYLNYSCDFVAMVYDYLTYCDDKEFIKQIFPYLELCVKRLCDTDATCVEGKLMPQVQRTNRKYIDNMCDESSYYMELVHTLKLYGEICRVAGKKDELNVAEKYLEKYKSVAGKYLDDNNIVQRKWGKDAKCVYVPQGQAFAILGGLCDKKQYEKIIDAFYTDRCAYPECGKSKYWWLKGIFEADKTEVALSIIRKEYGVLIESGETTCRERWDCENMDDVIYDYVASDCHGWSAGPAVFFKEYILGVKPLEYGYKKVKIEPSLGNLEYAEGTVPTPYGLIYVRADKSGVKYEVPQGVEVIKGE